MVTEITEQKQKQEIARTILEALQDWFEIEEGRESYITECTNQLFFAAQSEQKNIGFLCLKETGKDTVEISVMGVLSQYHRCGIGSKLFETAKSCAKAKGYSFLQVKTVQMGYYKDYDITNQFYLHLGFKEFEVIPTLWDKANPCQIYVMAL